MAGFIQPNTDFWNQFEQQPTTGGVTGGAPADPQIGSMGSTPYGGMQPPSYYAGGSSTFDESSPTGAPRSVTFDPSMPTKPGAPPYQPGPAPDDDHMYTMPDGRKVPFIPFVNPYGRQDTPNPNNPTGSGPYMPGEPEYRAPGGPFGTQPGSPNTGINGGNPGQPQAGGGVTMDDFNRAWMASSYPGTVDGLKQFYASDPKWAAAGVTLGGSKGDKVYGPGNAYWGDYVISAGTGGAGKSTGSGPTAGGGTGTLGSGYGDPSGRASGYMTAPLGEFTPPTEQDALNSPGLQFALSEANRMGQNSAAAKGTLLNGRFQQALAGSNIQNALQGYGDVYNRAANTFGINFGVQTRNQDSPFSKFYDLAKLGQQATSAS